jgi:hypothetical protein
MKLSCLFLLPSACAFSIPKKNGGRPLALQASRRDVLTVSASAAASVLLFPNARANADIDYEKIQDLLGRPDGSAPSVTYTASGRPTYLVEPTDEFKTNEAKASDFKRKQIQRKQDFIALLDKLDIDPNDQDLLAADLDALRNNIRSNNGLPLGITKTELVKRIRRRKAKRYWPVQVEIAYQDLLQELRQQQSPDYKDEENPL